MNDSYFGELTMTDEKETIDHKVSASGPKCFHNGIYHYRTIEQDGKQYCCLSDDTCMYFKKSKSNEDLCVAYNYQNKK